MKEAILIVNLDTIERIQSGAVIGEISLRLDGFTFPDERWSDFVVVVLDWWLSAVLNLLRHEAKHVQVRFMDGPYAVELEAQSTYTWQLRCIETRLHRIIKCESSVLVSPLLESLLHSANAVLRVCHEHRWWTRDEIALDASLGALRAHIKDQS